MVKQLIPGAPSSIGDAVRIFNKHVLNPVMLALAGRPWWYAARLEHVGRRSGRSFATPVVAKAVPGGFLVPLPYGPKVDWLRNLQASGSAVLVVQGRRYALGGPEVFTTQDLYPDLPRSEQLRSRLWHIEHWLKVSAVPAD